jgi:hypothetical protein
MIVTQLVKKYPTSLRKPKIHHRIHKNPPWTPSLASRIQFATSIPISPRSILILSSNLLLGHSSVLLPSGFQPKPCKHLLPTHACHMSSPSHPPQFNHPNNIRRRIKFMKLWLCNFLHDPSSSILGPNIIFNKLFSKALSLCSSPKVRDQASHPYSTTGKITVLCILFFKFFDIISISKWKRQNFDLEIFIWKSLMKYRLRKSTR